jgi:hypothetical protein
MTGYPDKPEVSTSYTGFQQSQGSSVFPGTALDEDLATLKKSIDEVVDFIKASFRSDGKLNNGLVTKDSLAASILFGIDAPVPWQPGTAYTKDQTISFGNGIYIAAEDHTSSLVFATDLAAVKWRLVAQFSVSSTPDDLSVSTLKIVDGAVTTPKLADQAVTTAKIADHAVGPTQLDQSLTFVPVGAEIDYAGIRLPAKWLWCNGQPYSRTTYAALLTPFRDGHGRCRSQQPDDRERQQGSSPRRDAVRQDRGHRHSGRAFIVWHSRPRRSR